MMRGARWWWLSGVAGGGGGGDGGGGSMVAPGPQGRYRSADGVGGVWVGRVVIIMTRGGSMAQGGSL